MKLNPRISVGMPVYNGEKYIGEAIESILAQTYPDLELLISDNASTDRTGEICRTYMARDKRIRYVQNAKNLGAARNYNQLVDMAQGDYFKWSAADDVCAPEFFARCIEPLDQDARLVLSHTKITDIDEHSKVIRDREFRVRIDEPQPSRRFYNCICIPHAQTAVFGLIRTDILKKTRLIGSYSSSDRTLLGELALRGPWHEVPERLFFKRHHPEAHWKVYTNKRERIAWYDPKLAGKMTFPHWRLLREHLISVRRVDMSHTERTKCYGVIAWWMRKNYRNLAKNMLLQG